jgi:hypothetical protein
VKSKLGWVKRRWPVRLDPWVGSVERRSRARRPPKRHPRALSLQDLRAVGAVVG